MAVTIALVGCSFVVGLIVLKIYIKSKTGMCRSRRDLSGKTAIITGSNTGIGFYTALDFAGRNARVILACRNTEKAEHAKQRIIDETGNTNIVTKLLDTSSLNSVRKFADDILKTESRLDILVNNAGITGLPFRMTDEGLERTWATNHFGPFLLTLLLIDLLKKSAPSRIVNVSSVAQKMTRQQIDFDNINSSNGFGVGSVYFFTKRANILFARELARRSEGTGVTVNSLHPGTVKSELLRYLPAPLQFVFKFIELFFKTTEEGAQTSIYCAISEEVEGISGKHFEDCNLADEGSLARDDEAAKKLWEVSLDLTGLRDNL